MKKLFYYEKRLDSYTSQELFNLLEEVSGHTIERFLGINGAEFSGLYSEEDISKIAKRHLEEYIKINNFMQENGEDPLFIIEPEKSDTENVKACGEQYLDLMKEKDEKQLEQEMGYTYNDYVPGKQIRKIDYLVKGLDINQKQNVFGWLNDIMDKGFAEQFLGVGEKKYSDSEEPEIIEECLEYFEEINELMKLYGRSPLFNIDSKKSEKENVITGLSKFTDLLMARNRDNEELLKEFGPYKEYEYGKGKSKKKDEEDIVEH